MRGLAPELFQQALGRIARGERGEPRDDAQASYAGPFEDDWRWIDWTRPAREIHNQVRSWSVLGHGTEGAHVDIAGEVMQIAKTRLLPHEERSVVMPGTILRRSEAGWVMQCGDGPIEIVAWSHVEAGL